MAKSRQHESKMMRRADEISALEGAWAAAHTRALRTIDELDAAERLARDLYPPRPPAANPGAWRRWHEQAEAIRRGFGVPALEDANDAAWRVVGRIAERIEALTPRNTVEAAIKLRVVLDNRVDDVAACDGGAPLRRLLGDLERLAERSALAA